MREFINNFGFQKLLNYSIAHMYINQISMIRIIISSKSNFRTQKQSQLYFIFNYVFSPFHAASFFLTSGVAWCFWSVSASIPLWQGYPPCHKNSRCCWHVSYEIISWRLYTCHHHSVPAKLWGNPAQQKHFHMMPTPLWWKQLTAKAKNSSAASKIQDVASASLG